MNSRIRAQQGGFLLFGGNQFMPISENRVREIIIPSGAKKSIRKELDTYFGINMGMIYPEPYNKVDYITKKSIVVENDVNYFSVVKKGIEYHINRSLDYIEYLSDEKERKVKLDKLIAYIYDVCYSLTYLKEKTNSETDIKTIEEIEKMVKDKIKELNSSDKKIINEDIIPEKTNGEE